MAHKTIFMNVKGQILQVEQISSNTLLNEVERLLDKKLAAITSPPASETDEFITRQNVADMFKISLPTVHAWMNAGILKPYKIANKTRFLRSEVVAAAKDISKKEVGHA